MIPTAGGQYHWVSLLAPPSNKKFFSYITGMRKLKRYNVETRLLTEIYRLAYRHWLDRWTYSRRLLCRKSYSSTDNPEQPYLHLNRLARDSFTLGCASDMCGH